MEQGERGKQRRGRHGSMGGLLIHDAGERGAGIVRGKHGHGGMAPGETLWR